MCVRMILIPSNILLVLLAWQASAPKPHCTSMSIDSLTRMRLVGVVFCKGCCDSGAAVSGSINPPPSCPLTQTFPFFALLTGMAVCTGSIEDVKWESVQVGQILQVKDDELFPADLMCLYTALPDKVSLAVPYPKTCIDFAPSGRCL